MKKNGSGIGSYLRYAFGEIILVTLGILIALYIKGWYQEGEDREELLRIGSQIMEDLKGDTADVAVIMKQYEPAKELYLRVMSDTMNLDSFKNCGTCPYLSSSFNPFLISQNGYSLLKDQETDYVSSMDSLIHDTKIFYELTIPLMDIIVEMIKDDVRDNLDYWSEHYTWYYKWVEGETSEDLYDFMLNDPIYKNQVANFYLLVYRNYLPAINSYSARAEVLLRRWERELAKHED